MKVLSCPRRSAYSEPSTEPKPAAPRAARMPVGNFPQTFALLLTRLLMYDYRITVDKSKQLNIAFVNFLRIENHTLSIGTDRRKVPIAIGTGYHLVHANLLQTIT